MTFTGKIEYRTTDADIYNERIKPFLPSRIFDAHAHLLPDSCHPDLFKLNPISAVDGLHDINVETLDIWYRTLFEGKKVDSMIMGFPTKGCDLLSINDFVFTQAGQKNYNFSLLVSPKLTVNQLQEHIEKYNPSGLKPYMVFVDRPDYTNCKITDMLPEEQIELADQYKLSVTLHVSKPEGMADKDNLLEIDHLSNKYPNCQFILAHCGRCFITANAKKMLTTLPHRDNIWLDTSAVCDAGVFIYLFRQFRLDRLIFGSDLVTAAGFWGSYIKLANSWKLYHDEQCTFEIYENLLALFEAADIVGLGGGQLEDIFYRNAVKLFKQNELR